ncbi:hypothetical protein [Tenacibaculum jejuense]|uniref:Lipoprotein n=1 Tax=Tenacibaculum jejuense TaxID=584609 RepID=A0A238UC06_9FLAO|nr:hypothetical protein [Tenacibaculum jejuense]SNR16747.1 conserved protein of unknown function [Tenacibaculum jejuense]
MEKLYYSLAALALILLYSCSEDENQNFSFQGHYEISQMTSDTSVDLNEDGIASTNLLNEIVPYYFENTVYDLEIRPHNYTESDAKLILFSIPHQILLFDDPNDQNSSIDYCKKGFGTSYEFSDNKIQLENFSNDFITIKNIEILSNDNIKTNIEKEYFDTETENWVKLSIEIVYQKIDLEAL